SLVVRHGPCASADEKVDANRASALARHCGSTATPLRVAVAWQPSFVFAFFPVALSLQPAHRFAGVVGRSAATNAPTLESMRLVMSAPSFVVFQPPGASPF